MFKRLRTTWLAGGGALLLVLSLSGVVAGASFLAATGPAQETADPEVVVDTTATFEDTNGNGIDDDCEEAEVADPVAEAAAEAAVDSDGDGVISVTEAAHSGRIGGKNCNHGGYVSSVAHGDDAACAAPETTEPEVTDPAEIDADEATEADEAVAEVPGGDEADETEDCATASAEDEDQGETVVSAIAKAAAKAAAKEAKAAAKEARKAEHDAAKAERNAAHDAAKAERAAAKAERAAAKADRQAAKAEKASKQKANGKGH